MGAKNVILFIFMYTYTHNDYKCIEIENQHIKNFKVRFLEKCEMVVRTL